MCDFVSWLEIKNDKGNDIVLYLDDDDIYHTKRGKLLQSYSGCEADLTGHGSIRWFYELSNKRGREKECTDFSSPDNFPKKIVSAIKEGKFKKMCAGDKEVLENVNVMLLPNARRKIHNMQYWNKYIDTIKFKSEKGCPLKIDVKEVKAALKRIFKDKEANAGEYCGNGDDILNLFCWSFTEEGYDYWEIVGEKIASDRNIEEDCEQVETLEQFWKLFKNPKNRVKQWR